MQVDVRLEVRLSTDGVELAGAHDVSGTVGQIHIKRTCEPSASGIGRGKLEEAQSTGQVQVSGGGRGDQMQIVRRADVHEESRLVYPEFERQAVRQPDIDSPAG